MSQYQSDKRQADYQKQLLEEQKIDEQIKVTQTNAIQQSTGPKVEETRRSFPKMKSLFNKESTEKRLEKERIQQNTGYRSGDKFEMDRHELVDNKLSNNMNSGIITNKLSLTPNNEDVDQEDAESSVNQKQDSEVRDNESQLAQVNQDGDDIANKTIDKWHDVKVVETSDGNQELVIENLENLADSTALIVTRDGKNFKIGLTQDNQAASDVGSVRDSHVDNRSHKQIQSQKMKLRGILGQRLGKESIDGEVKSMASIKDRNN